MRSATSIVQLYEDKRRCCDNCHNNLDANNISRVKYIKPIFFYQFKTKNNLNAVGNKFFYI